MPGKQDAGVELGELVQGSEIGGDVAFRVGDHGAALAEDQVAGEDRAILRQQKREVVGAVAGRVQDGDVDAAHADDVAVVERRMTLHGGSVLDGKALGQGEVVGV